MRSRQHLDKTPRMANLQPFIDRAGQWHGTSMLQDPSNNLKDESTTTATITSILGGRFVRFDYTWAYNDKPQEGSFLIGLVRATSVLTVHWIDSFHMSDVVMACTGTIDEAGTIDVRGSYAAPPEPDWGWRTVFTLASDSIRMVMFNIWPDGKEEMAVEAVYRPV